MTSLAPIINNGLLGNFKTVVDQTRILLVGLENKYSTVLSDFSIFKSEITSAENFKAIVHQTSKKFLSFNQTFADMADSVRQESALINQTETSQFFLQQFEDEISVQSLETTGLNLADLIDTFNDFYSSILISITNFENRANIYETSSVIYGLINGETFSAIANRWDKFYSHLLDLFTGQANSVEYFVNFIHRMFEGSDLGNVVSSSLEDLKSLLQNSIKFIDNILKKQQNQGISARRKRRAAEIAEPEFHVVEYFELLLEQLTDIADLTTEQFLKFQDSDLLKNSKLKEYLKFFSDRYDGKITQSSFSQELEHLLENSLADVIMKSTISGVEILNQLIDAIKILANDPKNINYNSATFTKLDEIVVNLIGGSDLGWIYQDVIYLVDDLVLILSEDGYLIDKLVGKSGLMENLMEKDLLEDSKIEKLVNRVSILVDGGNLKAIETSLREVGEVLGLGFGV